MELADSDYFPAYYVATCKIRISAIPKYVWGIGSFPPTSGTQRPSRAGAEHETSYISGVVPKVYVCPERHCKLNFICSRSV